MLDLSARGIGNTFLVLFRLLSAFVCVCICIWVLVCFINSEEWRPEKGAREFRSSTFSCRVFLSYFPTSVRSYYG